MMVKFAYWLGFIGIMLTYTPPVGELLIYTATAIGVYEFFKMLYDMMDYL